MKPDVILLDIALPGQDGLATAAELHTAVPGSAVVMLSLHAGAASRARAAAAGAATLVGKHEPIATLLAAVRAANVSRPH